MKRFKIVFGAVSIILSVLATPNICHAGKAETEVRVVVLPPRMGEQEDTYVKSFTRTDSRAEFASAFRRIDDPGLKGHWFLGRQIPSGEYEVHVFVGSGKPEAVRIVRIENRSETLYFGADATAAHIVIVDPLGDILTNVAIDKAVDAFGMDYAKTFGGTSSATVPSGTYEVQAHAGGYGVASGKVCFCQSESWAVLGVGIAGGDAVYPGATVRLKGNIQFSNPIKEPVIVRLAPAYMSSAMAVLISPGSGSKFELAGALPSAGDYVLLVSQSGNILGSGVFRLPLRTAVSFKLDAGAVISLGEDGQLSK